MVPTPDGASSANDDNLQCGKVFILHHEELEAASVDVLLNHIQSTFNVSSLICLGPLSTTVGNSQSVLTPSEYCVMLFRKFNLHANEREVVLGVEDQLIATQLCIAELNKKITGDFDVEVSKVLEFNKRLQIMKLKLDNDAGRDTADASELDSSLIQNTVCSGADVDFDSFICQYADFLKFNNNTDLMDVLTRLRKELNVNEELQKAIHGDNFLFLDTPKDKIESATFSLLAADKQIHWVRLEEPLISDESQTTLEIEQIKFEVTSINCILDAIPADVFPRSSKISLTEHYIEKLMLGYLHLLVNTRSEIALARVINVPERGINHEAFTEIKHMAQIKQLAMYQTVTSFVLKLRLGGQMNTCVNSKLSQHIKGLGEFTDMMHKLQTILEEELDTRNAVRRVLNVIKKIIISCHDNTLRQSSIERVTDHLQGYATSVINVMQTIINNSPGRSVSVGGSLVGRQSLKVLRCILDHAATQPQLSSVLDTLTDIVSSQKTPLKFPSIMSQFRSPIEASPQATESRSLAQRIKEKCHVEKKRSKMQCDSFLDWAKPIHDTGINEGHQSQFARDCYVPSKTIVHPGSKCLEAMMDQENICSILPEKPLTAAKSTHPCGNDTRMKHNIAASSKRPLNDAVNETKPKRAKMMNSVATQGRKIKTSRRKLVPLPKGQKTLSAFFRL